MPPHSQNIPGNLPNPNHNIQNMQGPNNLPNPYSYQNPCNEFKYICNFEIQIENEENFRVTRRIIGNKGFKLRQILNKCDPMNEFSTKIRLRGRGSGFREGPNQQESDENLQLCISSLSYGCYVDCCVNIHRFLRELYVEYEYYVRSNRLDTELIPTSIKKIETCLHK